MKLDRRVRAVLLDVDGTLYRQNALRAFMLLELCASAFFKSSYLSRPNLYKVLWTFRRVREELRELGAPLESLHKLQYVYTARRMNREPDAVEAVVSEWILFRPLKYIRFCRRRRLKRFCEFLAARNIAVGMFSDYPVDEKLRALRLSGCKIWPVICATDPPVNAFKPHPKGFLHACELWGVAPGEVLYVGDRFEIDAAGAAAAGMPCAIISNRARRNGRPANCFVVSSFGELQNVLIDSIGR